jgi:hypothetical protein
MKAMNDVHGEKIASVERIGLKAVIDKAMNTMRSKVSAEEKGCESALSEVDAYMQEADRDECKDLIKDNAEMRVAVNEMVKACETQIVEYDNSWMAIHQDDTKSGQEYFNYKEIPEQAVKDFAKIELFVELTTKRKNIVKWKASVKKVVEARELEKMKRLAAEKQVSEDAEIGGLGGTALEKALVQYTEKAKADELRSENMCWDPDKDLFSCAAENAKPVYIAADRCRSAGDAIRADGFYTATKQQSLETMEKRGLKIAALPCYRMTVRRKYESLLGKGSLGCAPRKFSVDEKVNEVTGIHYMAMIAKSSQTSQTTCMGLIEARLVLEGGMHVYGVAMARLEGDGIKEKMANLSEMDPVKFRELAKCQETGFYAHLTKDVLLLVPPRFVVVCLAEPGGNTHALRWLLPGKKEAHKGMLKMMRTMYTAYPSMKTEMAQEICNRLAHWTDLE